MAYPRHVARAGSATDAAVLYDERLRAPWWWYPVGIFVAGLLGAEFHMADETLTDWLPYAILVPLAILIVWRTGSQRLVISDGEVRVRGAHLPLDAVSGVVRLDERTLRRVVGREGDPAAFVAIRPWVKPGIQLWLDDPDDPTPYWVISSRHPDRVVGVVREQLAGRHQGFG